MKSIQNLFNEADPLNLAEFSQLTVMALLTLLNTLGIDEEDRIQKELLFSKLLESDNLFYFLLKNKGNLIDNYLTLINGMNVDIAPPWFLEKTLKSLLQLCSHDFQIIAIRNKLQHKKNNVIFDSMTINNINDTRFKGPNHTEERLTTLLLKTSTETQRCLLLDYYYPDNFILLMKYLNDESAQLFLNSKSIKTSFSAAITNAYLAKAINGLDESKNALFLQAMKEPLIRSIQTPERLIAMLQKLDPSKQGIFLVAIKDNLPNKITPNDLEKIMLALDPKEHTTFLHTMTTDTLAKIFDKEEKIIGFEEDQLSEVKTKLELFVTIQKFTQQSKETYQNNPYIVTSLENFRKIASEIAIKELTPCEKKTALMQLANEQFHNQDRILRLFTDIVFFVPLIVKKALTGDHFNTWFSNAKTKREKELEQTLNRTTLFQQNRKTEPNSKTNTLKMVSLEIEGSNVARARGH